MRNFVLCWALSIGCCLGWMCTFPLVVMRKGKRGLGIEIFYLRLPMKFSSTVDEYPISSVKSSYIQEKVKGDLHYKWASRCLIESSLG